MGSEGPVLWDQDHVHLLYHGRLQQVFAAARSHGISDVVATCASLQCSSAIAEAKSLQILLTPGASGLCSLRAEPPLRTLLKLFDCRFARSLRAAPPLGLRFLRLFTERLSHPDCPGRGMSVPQQVQAALISLAADHRAASFAEAP